jgi:hypothetical protein
MSTLPRRLSPAALLLGLVAILISLPQTLAWAQGEASGSVLTPGWLGLIFGVGGVVLGAYGTWLMLRRDVAGLRKVVYGERADEADGLMRRMSKAEAHAANNSLHPCAANLVGTVVCRQQRDDCATARSEALTGIREDMRSLTAKVDRLLERGQ